jgi:hypothetical protein
VDVKKSCRVFEDLLTGFLGRIQKSHEIAEYPVLRQHLDPRIPEYKTGTTNYGTVMFSHTIVVDQ